MATAEELRRQIAESEAAFESTRQQIESFDPRIRLTQQQLRQQTLQSRAELKAEQARREREKRAALGELVVREKQFQEEITPIKSQISAAEQQQAIYEEGKRAAEIADEYYRRGKFPVGQSKEVQRIWREKTAISDYNTRIEELQKLSDKASGVVSESVYQKIKEAADKSGIFSESATALAKIKGYIPDSSLNASVGLDPSGKPILEVKPSPTLGEQYKSAIQREGYVSGSLSFLAGKAGEKVDWLSQKYNIQKQTPGRTYGSAFISPSSVQKVTRYSPYFIPFIGSALLLSEGTESYATPSGRRRLGEQAEYLKSTYNIPKGVSYSIPAAEIGLGGLGLYSEFKALRTAKELKEFEKAPTILTGTRYEIGTGERGIYDVTLTKYTPKYQYLTTSKQYYEPLGKTGSIAFGEATATRISRFKPYGEFTFYDILGRGFKTGRGRIRTSLQEPALTASIPLKYETSLGRSIITPRYRGTFFIRASPTTEKAKIFYRIGNKRNLFIEPLEEESIKKTFFSVFKEKKKSVNILGGEVTSLRRYTKSGRTKAIGKPSVVGIIKRVKIESPGSGEAIKIFRSGKTKTPLSKTFQISAPIEVDTILKALAPVKTERPLAGLGLAVSAKTGLLEASKTRLETSAAVTPSLSSKEIVKTAFKPEVIQKEKSLLKTGLGEALMILDNQLSKSTPILKLESGLKQKPEQRLKQALLQTTAPSSKTIPRLTPGIFLFPKLKTSKTESGRAVVKTSSGYDVYGKEKGKWKKLNKNTITRQQALDLGSYIIDNSLSASFKLKPSNKQIKEPALKIPKGYFSRTSNKFRDYRKRKSSRIKTQDTWIEKRKYRLDTPKETRSIQAARRSLFKKSKRRSFKWI